MRQSCWTLIVIPSLLLFSGCRKELEIRDQAIPFSEARVGATLEYIEAHYGKSPKDIAIVPRMIVLHWTAIGTLERSLAAFDPERLYDSRPDLAAAGDVNVSIQFLVDRNGMVYRLMPETWMARHVIGLNYSAIGVENVGGVGGIDDMTDEQMDANIELVRYLVKKYPTIEFLIGHMEYQEFEGHPLWLELDEGYRTEKIDPGDRFMSAVREAVSDLKLLGPP